MLRLNCVLRIIVAAFSLFFLKRKETEGRRQRAHLLEGGREGAPARCACEADCSIKRTFSVKQSSLSLRADSCCNVQRCNNAARWCGIRGAELNIWAAVYYQKLVLKNCRSNLHCISEHTTQFLVVATDCHTFQYKEH